MNYSETKLLVDLSRVHVKSIAQAVADKLIQLKDKSFLLSGDDSGLKNCWEEICAQIQSERSYYWDVYILTINNFIEAELENLPEEVKILISYVENVELEDEEVDSYIVNETLIIKAIRNEIHSMAEDFKNRNIINFIEGKMFNDEEEQEDEDDN